MVVCHGQADEPQHTTGSKWNVTRRIVLALIILAGLGMLVVLVTRFVLCVGIEEFADVLHLSSKAKGQILGYSTSVPELAGTVSTAAIGLLGAGLWNIAASNIINLGLFLAANLFYRQYRELPRVKFLDEIGFALGAIAIPMFLVFSGKATTSVWTAVGLISVFVAYVLADRKMNVNQLEKPANDEKSDARASGPDQPDAKDEPLSTMPRDLRIARALGMILAGVAGIVVLGRFLGSSAEDVVTKMGISQAAVGWILGVATSLPEMTSFFAIYASSKRKGTLALELDTQEALDNLTASNMSNLGIVYPLGILVFLLAGY